MSAVLDTKNGLTLPGHPPGRGEYPLRERAQMSLHPLLKQQFEDARQDGAQLDLGKLLHSISVVYAAWDDERRGVVRSMNLLADETTALTREVRESAASQLQAILDHVKDAILTVDDSGRIQTLNSTGERVFGYEEDAVRGRKLDLLIPSLARRPSLTETLAELAESLENTQVDLAPRETRGRRQNGTLFDAELGVSLVKLDRRDVFIVCLRETSDRKLAEAAIRDSEARYRTLVENAPEAIVVLDVDLGHFVECNENAVRFFKMTRDELLAVGPEKISPPQQADGTLFVRRRPRPPRSRARGGSALLRVDAPGRTGPRHSLRGSPGTTAFLRPSTDPRQHHRHHRAQAQRVACDRRAPRLRTHHRQRRAAEALEAIAETAERVTPDSLCSVSLLDAPANALRYAAGQRLPHHFRKAIEQVEVGPRNGSCAAAIFLQRQVVVAEIARDALWEHLRAPALAAGLRACWSTPIRAADGRMLGTVALHFSQPRSPLKRDFELMARLTALAGIAIDRKHSEEALRRSEARYRGLFENVIEGVYRTDARRAPRVGQSCPGPDARIRDAEELLALPSTSELYVDPADRERVVAALQERGHGAQRGIPAAPTRRPDHHRGRERPRAARRRGAVIGYEGTLADISKRKASRGSSPRRRRRRRSRCSRSATPCITTDADGRVEYLNPVAEELTGWTTAEAQGRPLGEVFQIVKRATREPLESPSCAACARAASSSSTSPRC